LVPGLKGQPLMDKLGDGMSFGGLELLEGVSDCWPMDVGSWCGETWEFAC